MISLIHKMNTISHFQIDVFDNESGPLIKLFNRALATPEIVDSFTDDELDRVVTFIDCFKEEALNN